MKETASSGTTFTSIKLQLAHFSEESHIRRTDKCGYIENTCRLTKLGIFLRILNLPRESVMVNCVLLVEQLNDCEEDHLLYMKPCMPAHVRMLDEA